MNRYYVKIDGQEAPDSYSYEELRAMGVLDFDDIQVRETLDSSWHSAKYYNFPEAGTAPQVEIDEYGQIRTHEPSQDDIQIDEFGQIRSNNTSTETDTTSSSNNSKSDDGVVTFFKVLLTIAIIAGAAAIAIATVGWGTPIAYAAWKLIEAIWKDDN